MKRPEINGWEVTTNENGIKMATLPRDTMDEIVKYIEYADKQLCLADVSNSLPQIKCLICGYDCGNEHHANNFIEVSGNDC